MFTPIPVEDKIARNSLCGSGASLMEVVKVDPRGGFFEVGKGGWIKVPPFP